MRSLSPSGLNDPVLRQVPIPAWFAHYASQYPLASSAPHTDGSQRPAWSFSSQRELEKAAPDESEGATGKARRSEERTADIPRGTNKVPVTQVAKRSAAANLLTPEKAWRGFGSKVGSQPVQAALICAGARQILSLKRHEQLDCGARNSTDEKCGSYGTFPYSCQLMKKHE